MDRFHSVIWIYFTRQYDAKRARPEGALLPSEATKRNDPFASLAEQVLEIVGVKSGQALAVVYSIAHYQQGGQRKVVVAYYAGQVL